MSVVEAWITASYHRRFSMPALTTSALPQWFFLLDVAPVSDLFLERLHRLVIERSTTSRPRATAHNTR